MNYSNQKHAHSYMEHKPLMAKVMPKKTQPHGLEKQPPNV